MRLKPTLWLMCIVMLIICKGAPDFVLAQDSCRISVATILAARDGATVDPKLESQIAGLQSTFNYTSYRLLGSEHLTLETGQSGSLSLPGNHELSITLQQIQGDRASLDMQLVRQQHAVFQTIIHLLNRGSLFIGGPEYLNGNLIFKISGAF